MSKYSYMRRAYATNVTIFKDGIELCTTLNDETANSICKKLNLSEPSNATRTIVATACLQGILSTLSVKTDILPHIAENCVKEAILCANELLKQLNK